MKQKHTTPKKTSAPQTENSSAQSNNKLDVVLIDKWEGVEPYASAWRELTEKAPSATIFQTFEWHKSWWSAFGESHNLCILLCHSNNRLVGIAPMMVTKSEVLAGNKKVLRFIGCVNNSSDYLDMIVDPRIEGVLTELLRSIHRYLAKVDRILLSHYPSHFSSQQKVVQFFQDRQVKFELKFDQEAPCRVLGNKEEDKKAASKSSLRRRYNFFNKSGELQFRRCENEDEVLNYIDQFFSQHVKRREMAGSPSQFCNPAERLFYINLVKQMISGEWLKFDVVLFNSLPIAFHFGFEYRNKFYWYKPTFDISLAKRSPGEVLIKFLLESAIENNLDEFDFTVGSESFKYRFSNEIRQNNRIIVFRSSFDYWFYRLDTLLDRIRQKIVSLIGAK